MRSSSGYVHEKVRGNLYVLRGGGRTVQLGGVNLPNAGNTVDADNGGSVVEYPQTITKAVAALTNIDTIVTGHYQTPLTMADLKTYGDFTREFVQAVQAGKKAGRTIDDFVDTGRLPERFVEEGYAQATHLRPLRGDVEVVWNETKELA